MVKNKNSHIPIRIYPLVWKKHVCCVTTDAEAEEFLGFICDHGFVRTEYEHVSS